MPDLRFSILPAPQQTVWKILAQRAQFLWENGYYLAGGTALALQLGHRLSVDFDFFSQQSDNAARIEEELQQIPGFLTRDLERHTLHAEIGSVKLSFIGGYKYPLLEHPFESQGIRLARIPDIGPMKLLAISHRATPRDYLDIAAILRSGFSLADLLSAATRKYGGAFNPMIPLRALTAFNDLEGEMPVMLDQSLTSSWQDILRAAVRDVGTGK